MGTIEILDLSINLLEIPEISVRLAKFLLGSLLV